jgi:hypothetical protein
MVLIQTGWVIISPSMKNTNSACVFADAVTHVTVAGKWVAGMGTNLIVIFNHKCPLDGLKCACEIYSGKQECLFMCNNFVKHVSQKKYTCISLQSVA